MMILPINQGLSIYWQSLYFYHTSCRKMIPLHLQKESANERNQSDVFSNIEQWSNDMASGMMTLEQEMAAFGEKMPEPRYGKNDKDDKENENPGDSDDDDDWFLQTFVTSWLFTVLDEAACVITVEMQKNCFIEHRKITSRLPFSHDMCRFNSSC